MLRIAQILIVAAVSWFVLDYAEAPVSGLAAGVVSLAVAYVLTKVYFALRFGIYLGPPEPEHHNQRYWRINYPPSYFD